MLDLLLVWPKLFPFVLVQIRYAFHAFRYIKEGKLVKCYLTGTCSLVAHLSEPCHPLLHERLHSSMVLFPVSSRPFPPTFGYLVVLALGLLQRTCKHLTLNPRLPLMKDEELKASFDVFGFCTYMYSMLWQCISVYGIRLS